MLQKRKWNIPLIHYPLMTYKNFILVVGLAIYAPITSMVAFAETIVPWNLPTADQRQVFEIRATAPAKSPWVDIPTTWNSVLKIDGGSLQFVDAANSEKPLTVFKGTDSYSVAIEGTLDKEHPRRIVAYRGEKIASSPTVPAKPEANDDYATVQQGTPWNFDDGKYSCIDSWGVDRKQYGDVAVKDGWLRIPILGNDVYFVFGLMWGSPEHPKNLNIDSSVYRFLELRVRQSCETAAWQFYVTDKDGVYKYVDFVVRGKEPQVFRFDLKEIFPDFWDGRTFKSIRIDPIKKQPKTVAEINYVRILPNPPAVLAGPMLTRAEVSARNKVKSISVDVRGGVFAGAATPLTIRCNDASGNPVANNAAIPWTSQGLSSQIDRSPTDAKGVLKGHLLAYEKAGAASWTVGLADDLGNPYHAVTGKINVRPNSLREYRLTTNEFVDVADDAAKVVEVVGVDVFGNLVPLDVQSPKWTVDGGGSVEQSVKPLKGNKQTVLVRLSKEPRKHHRITLTDEKGRTGSTTITTVSYRNNMIRLNENGYMVTPNGSLFFPVGGLYANWPHALPKADGSINRAIDLFPCHALPYVHGFPWPEKVEQAVVTYLDHCRSHKLNTLRLMLRNMDIVGRVDPVQLKAVLHLFDLARERGIMFNVVLFEDYDKPPYVNGPLLEKIVLPHYTKEELAALPPYRAKFLVDRKVLKTPESRYADPDVELCHRDYLRELLPVLAGREEVLCYEFENEMHAVPLEWCRKTAAFIRTIDPHTLILGNPHPMYWPKPLDWRDSNVDMVAIHPYNNGRSNADMGTLFHVSAKMAAQTKFPFNTGEGGVYDGQIPYDKPCVRQRMQGARDQIWMTICAGGNGFLYWTVMNETILAEFGKIKPALDALGIDLQTIKRRRADVAVVMPARGNKAITWNMRDDEANRNADALAKRLLECGVDYDLPPQGEEAAYPVQWNVLTTNAATLERQAKLKPTVAQPKKGWDVATLLSDDGKRAVLYFRNVAGVTNYGTEKRPCYCRDVDTGDASLRLTELKRWSKIVAYDLDAGTSKTVVPDADGNIRLGNTASDFVIGLQ